MIKTEACIWLSPADRATLEGWVNGRNTPQKLVWRGRIVLLSADRTGVMTITRAIGRSKVTVARWQERYLAKGLDGLRRDATRSGRKPPLRCRNRQLPRRQSNRSPFAPSMPSRTARFPVSAIGPCDANVSEMGPKHNVCVKLPNRFARRTRKIRWRSWPLDV